MTCPARDCVRCWVCATAAAATWMAGVSRKPCNRSCDLSRDSTSSRRAASCSHAWRRNWSRCSGEHCNVACSRLSTCFQRSALIGGSTRHLPVKPCPRGAPITHHRDRGNFEHLGGFFHAQSAKKTQLDDVGFSLIQTGKLVHGIVERHQVFSPVRGYHRGLLERQVWHARPAFEIMPPRVVHENAAH